MGGGKSGGKASGKKSHKSHTAMAGLTFPVSRVRRHMRGRHAPRIRKKVPIYLAAVLEYLVAEVLNQAGIAADSQKKTRVLPRHVQLAIRTDQELKELLKGVTIAEGGVMPYIHENLLPKKIGSKR